MKNLEFIHIGKCGGTTVNKVLKSNNIKFIHIHCRKVIYKPNKNYVIVIRNPIQRFISAFYWRKYLVCDIKIQKNKFKNEQKIINKYKNVNNLCNDLKKNLDIFNGNRSSGNYIHHLKEDIHFYLDNFIDKCPKKQIVGVICTETLNDDMKNIFNIDVSKHEKNNKYCKNVSDKSYEILKNYLSKDYKIIEKMFKKGWISNQQYNILKS